MSPTLSHLPLPNPSDENYVHIISNLLTPSECQTCIDEYTPALTTNGMQLTNRLRHLVDDEKLADKLWQRLMPFYGDVKIVDEEQVSWSAAGLNSRFRFCLYESGGIFDPHFDGRRLATPDSQTFMTVNLYLNTVEPQNGGATRILKPADNEVLGKVQPVEGSAAVFRDSLWHDGEEVRGGIKYLLRTDIVFSRDEPFDFESICVGLSKEEQGRKALALAIRLEDGKNQQEALVWYRKAYRLWPDLDQ